MILYMESLIYLYISNTYIVGSNMTRSETKSKQRIRFKSKIAKGADFYYIRIPSSLEPMIKDLHGKAVIVTIEVVEGEEGVE